MQNATPFRQYHLQSPDGLKLYLRDYEPDSAQTAAVAHTPIFCLAGLTRNSRDFHQIAMLLHAMGYRVICPDARGRGQSDWDSDKSRYTPLQEMTDVLFLMDELKIKTAHFIGTSRGGILLHLLANFAPERIKSVVLNDIGPTLHVVGLGAIAAYLGKAPPLSSWAEAEAKTKAIHAKSFPALNDEDWADFTRAIYRENTDGSICPDYDSAIGDQIRDLDLTQPIPDLWTQFTALAPYPTLVIRGENSTLLTRETVSEMLSRNATCSSIEAPGQGHAPLLHLEPVKSAILQFFAHQA